MPRPGITKLKMPPIEYRPDKIMDGFEKVAAMQNEDLLRARLLEQTKHAGRFGDAARELASRLRQGTVEAPAQTPASALYMRDQRIRIVGNLHQLIDKSKPERSSVFSIVKKGWAFNAAELFEANAIKIKQAFRADLLRAGSAAADGWLLGALDCEYDELTKNYQFHMHGVAADGMIDVIDRIRRRPGYKAWESILGVPDCRTPIVVSRKALSDLPRPIAYQFKHFWKMKILDKARRLPGDEHTRALLFLDRYRLEDLTLLMKLGVKAGRLCPK